MKTKQVQYMPDDPVLVFRAALTVRRQMIVDQQEIVRRHPDAFNTSSVKRCLRTSENNLKLVTLNLRRIYDGVAIPPSRRKAIITQLDTSILHFLRILNFQRVQLAQSRARYVTNLTKAALARMEDLDVAHPEHTFDLIGLF